MPTGSRVKIARPVRENSGWRPDADDPRDFVYERTNAKVPSAVDLSKKRPGMPDAWFQGNLPSCVANAVAAAWAFAVAQKFGRQDATPSRLFVYYEGRRVESNVRDCEGGTQIRNCFKAINRSGVPPEDIWPYDISKCAVPPPRDVYTRAKSSPAIRYSTIDPPDRVGAIKEVIASGSPVAFGFFVEYDLKKAAATGIVDVTPGGYGTTETPADHAALIVGYDDDEDEGRFKVRNASGPTWGDGAGNFRMAYDYAEMYGSDFWFINDIVMEVHA